MVNPSLDLLLPAWVTGLEEQIPVDQRRMILDLIDVTVRWDMKCKSERAALEQQQEQQSPNQNASSSAGPSSIGGPVSPSLVHFSLSALCCCYLTSNHTNNSVVGFFALQMTDRPELMPMEKSHRDQLANLMIRFACQAMEATSNGISSETSARKALSLVESTLSSDIWGGETCDLRLNFIDRFLCPEDSNSSQTSTTQQQSQQQQQQNMNALLSSCTFMTLEVLRVVYSTLESSTLLSNVKHFGKSIISLLSRFSTTYRLMRACGTLMKVLLLKFPAEPSNRQKITVFPELYELYDIILKFIQESFTLYTDGSPVNSTPQESAALSQLTDLLIQTLDVFKSRMNVMSTEMRKNAFGPDFLYILERARDAKLFRAVVRILRDWINVPKAEEHFAPTTREKVAFFVRLWSAYSRWSEHSEAARDILDCIYQVGGLKVFSNVSTKTHEIFVKMEQAFCCGLLSPLPDIREKYVNLFLLGSDLISAPFFIDNETEASSNTAMTTTAKSSLLARLLFLFVSNSWDELHYKDGFWLPVFFDAIIVQSEARFFSLLERDARASNLASQTPVHCTKPDFTDVKLAEVEMKGETTKSTETSSISTFECLMNQQATVFNDIKAISFRETLRGLLNLVHHRPAIASELFGQLWHCVWHRFLLRESGNLYANSSSSSHLETTGLPDNFADTSPVASTSTTGGGVGSMSPSQLRHFLLPYITKFLSSDDHVNTVDILPSSIGNTLTCFTTTADSLLAALPLPVLSVGFML
ncbi:unnamed protein product [Hydatigera taeniaeformis]|uniref:DUF1981 domain-containing protein n=1 Tax=Hydatigena taeniaeformis TaxID=6205 RepID=A0A0R3XAX1_HYDTA|nr:unnamed protein product [Hydatigera taeniaeformis]